MKTAQPSYGPDTKTRCTATLATRRREAVGRAMITKPGHGVPGRLLDSIGFGSPAAVRSRRHWNWLTKKAACFFSTTTTTKDLNTRHVVGPHRCACRGLVRDGWLDGRIQERQERCLLPWLGNAPDVRTAPSPPSQHAQPSFTRPARRSRAESPQEEDCVIMKGGD